MPLTTADGSAGQYPGKSHWRIKIVYSDEQQFISKVYDVHAWSEEDAKDQANLQWEGQFPQFSPTEVTVQKTSR